MGVTERYKAYNRHGCLGLDMEPSREPPALVWGNAVRPNAGELQLDLALDTHKGRCVDQAGSVLG